MESEQRRARDEEECLGRINNELVADRVKEMMLSDDVHDVISRRHTNTSLFPLRPPQNGISILECLGDGFLIFFGVSFEPV
jgi:hypothetical protein